MLWAVRYEWPSGAQVTFNCYLHWATLVLHDTEDGSGHCLHSKEGMNQRDPLTMIAYDIWVIHLMIELREARPRVISVPRLSDMGVCLPELYYEVYNPYVIFDHGKGVPLVHALLTMQAVA